MKISPRLAEFMLIIGLVACSPKTAAPALKATNEPKRQPTLLSRMVIPSSIPTSISNPSPPIGRIVFSAGPHPHQDIYVIGADGTGLTQLTTDPAADYDPSWSPDGKRIAFRSRRDGNDEIYTMNADGSEQTNLTRHPAMDLSPAWSPDGTQIAFASNREMGEASTLWVMNADGSDPRRIGDGTGEYPSWSPDGTQLAFDYQTYIEAAFDIWAISLDGSTARELAAGISSQQGPDWSPDGTQIVFESELEAGNGFNHIWLMNRDGTGQRRLSEDYGERPAWSPDGQYIVYSAGDLYIMKSDGSEVVRLPLARLSEIAFPDWIK